MGTSNRYVPWGMAIKDLHGIKGQAKTALTNSLTMPRRRQSSAFEMTWIGNGVNDVSAELVALVEAALRRYSCGAPVRATVVLVERMDTDNGRDTLGIVEVNGTYYFLLITNVFLLIMDLHYARNEAVAHLLDFTIHIP